MKKKVAQLVERLPSLEEELGRPDVLGDQKKYRGLTQEHARISQVKHLDEEIESFKKQLQDNQELLQVEEDAAFIEVLQEDIAGLEKKIEQFSKDLESLLVPPDPDDHRSVIVELRAGTGGDEAGIFVGDCVRMYRYFADKNRWTCEELSSTSSERGGFKEYVMAVSGSNAHRFMQYEGGTHRVQRVPETEAQGRVHTSAITVAILKEPDEEEDIALDEKDLRVDTYRASGSGGQHVNTTDSAVRITHIPTGMVAYCSEEKSQHKNKDKALRLLKAKIVEAERQKRQQEEAALRSSQVGTGDRSGRIRTYNFPQNRITDHRINFTRYNLDLVMNGELQELVHSLVAHYYQQLMDA